LGPISHSLLHRRALKKRRAAFIINLEALFSASFSFLSSECNKTLSRKHCQISPNEFAVEADTENGSELTRTIAHNHVAAFIETEFGKSLEQIGFSGVTASLINVHHVHLPGVGSLPNTQAITAACM
jgi:hypothetical protein